MLQPDIFSWKGALRAVGIETVNLPKRGLPPLFFYPFLEVLKSPPLRRGVSQKVLIKNRLYLGSDENRRGVTGMLAESELLLERTWLARQATTRGERRVVLLRRSIGPAGSHGKDDGTRANFNWPDCGKPIARRARFVLRRSASRRFEVNDRVIVIVGAILSTLRAGSIVKAARIRNRRLITLSVLLLLAATPLLFGIGQSGYALARSRTQVATLSQNQHEPTTSLGSMLNADGTLNLDGKFSGSLDPKGWSMVNEPGAAPRFVASTGAQIDVPSTKSPSVPGDENWDDRFVPPGTDNPIMAIAVGGNGDIYVGGAFGSAGGVPASRIAKWNGSAWSALGSGTDNEVLAIAITGSDIYVGGRFTVAGGVTVNHIAKWNGSAWSALGSGTNDRVFAVAVNNNGDIYVGGIFTTAGGTTASRIARWNGSAWSALGSGTNSDVDAITPLGNGSLYVGGYFTSAGGSAASHIAKWDSTSSQWSTVGTGTNGAIYAIALAGTSVYVGGTFTTAGGVSANNAARFDGSAWSALGIGVNSFVFAIAIGSSGDVFMGGTFTTAGGVSANNIARWNGSAWSAMSTGTNGGVQGLVASGSGMYVGGQFSISGGLVTDYAGRWDGNAWHALGDGASNTVQAVAVSGSDVYVAGSFTTVGGVVVNHIAMWDGFAWHALGGGTDSSTIYAVAVSGSYVYVGGIFTTAGGVPANNIAKWNGTSWSALGSGTNNAVFSLAVTGSDVFAGGTFSAPGSYIAKWNGNSWSTLGGGTDGEVLGIAITGSDVYAVGPFFHAGGNLASGVARWNGSAWSTLGQGFDGWGIAVAISGSDVYVAGHFSTAGGNAANNIAKWNGGSWAAMGSGVEDDPYAVTVSTGGDVYVGGQFILPTSRIAKWNGSTWSDLGSGADSDVHALAFRGNDDLYVGGSFGNAGGKRSANVGLWHTLGQPTATPTTIPTNTPPLATNTNTPSPTWTRAVATATPIPSCAIQFTDVPSGSTFWIEIRCLVCRGIVSGYSCGGAGEPCDPNNSPYFRPNVTVRRGQLSKIVSNAAGFNEPAGAQIFEDVPVGSTFFDFVNRLASRGYIGGYLCGGPGEPCGTGNLPYFRPNNQATRGQISKIVSNAAGFNDPVSGQRFQDVPPGSTFYDFIERLASRAVMSGYVCGGPGEPCVPPDSRPYFRPNNNATRGQTSKIVANAFFPNCQTPYR